MWIVRGEDAAEKQTSEAESNGIDWILPWQFFTHVRLSHKGTDMDRLCGKALSILL